MGRKRTKKTSETIPSSSHSRISSLRDGIDKDNETIRVLEKKLGFKKNKNASSRCFDEFGLSDIWSIIDKVEEKPVQEENKQKIKGRKRKIESFDDDDEKDQTKDDEGDGADEELNDQVLADDNDSDFEKDSFYGDDERKNEFKEDIYGRLRDKKGNIIKVEPTKKEIEFICDEIDANAMKRIRGLLNRLSASNLMTISSSIEDILKDYSLFVVTQCLSKCINDQLIQKAFLSPQRLIGEYAMLIAVLNTNIGDEVGGHIIHQFVKLFDSLFSQLTDSKEDEESKKIDNLVAFISYLYGCSMIDSNLIFDILEKLVDRFNSKCIQLIILVLRMVGFILRRGDPSKLRKMVIDIQSQTTKFEAKDNRIVFMLEALAAIKNNNITKLNNLNEDSPISSIDLNLLRTTIKNGLRAKSSVSCIPGKYNEVIQSNRWWITGGLLLEKLKIKKVEEPSPALICSEAKSSTSSEPDLCDSLCAKLRLVTPVRKAIFKALINCEDYIECTQRLNKAAGKQFSEVINVCLLVALKEKKFNPFYVYLFKQLSTWDRKYKLALLYAIKDKFNEPDRLSKVEKSNICKLVVELLKLDVIPITVLKAFQFNELTEESVDLLKSILIPVFTSDETTISKILSKIKPQDPLTVALKLFISCFMDPKYKEKMLFLKK